MAMGTPSRRPGRPLDRSRDAAIIDATIALFAEVGFDQLTVAAVARRAGVGLSTIYRRWPSRSELVAAAIGVLLDTSAEPDDPLRPSHLQVFERLHATLMGPERPFYPGLINAMANDANVAAAVRERSIEPYRRALRTYVEHRLGPGADPEVVSLLADLGPSLLVHRSLVIREDVAPHVVPLLARVLDVAIDAVMAASLSNGIDDSRNHGRLRATTTRTRTRVGQVGRVRGDR